MAQRAEAGARRWFVAGRVLGIIACLLSMAGGTMFGILFWGSSSIRGAFVRMVGEGFKHPSLDPLAIWQPYRQFPGVSSINILVLGVDYDYSNKNQILKTHGRSDTILLAHIDFAKRRITAMTLPRDTAMEIPGRRGIYKANAAHQFGGPDLTAQMLRDSFGVETDYWATLNFKGFEQLIDAIGGVDITVKKRMKYDDNWGHLHIDLHPGFQHMTGYQAMGFVRMRHNDSDLMRAERQHEFIEAVRNRLKQPTVFFDLAEAVEKLAGNVKRSPRLSEDRLFAIANFARGLPKENVVIKTIPTRPASRAFLAADPDPTAELVAELFFDGNPAAVTINVPSFSRAAASGGGRGRRSRRGADGGDTGSEALDAPVDDTQAGDIGPDPGSDPVPAPAPDDPGVSPPPATPGDPPPATNPPPTSGTP